MGVGEDDGAVAAAAVGTVAGRRLRQRSAKEEEVEAAVRCATVERGCVARRDQACRDAMMTFVKGLLVLLLFCRRNGWLRSI